jgi:hypothetical protein
MIEAEGGTGVTELGELASHLGYWVVYRNWYGTVSYLIYRWDEHLPIFGQSFPTEEEALNFLTPIRSQPRWRLKLDDPSLTVQRAPYGVSVTENRVGGRTFSAPVLTEASYIDVQGADVPTIGDWERLPALTAEG